MNHDMLRRNRLFCFHLIPMTLDFTLTTFRSLCSAVAQHYPTLTLAKYFQGNNLPPRFALMRHDIDRKPGNALSTARVEAGSGIRATYYFRRYGSAFRPGIMRERKGGARGRSHYEVRGNMYVSEEIKNLKPLRWVVALYSLSFRTIFFCLCHYYSYSKHFDHSLSHFT